MWSLPRPAIDATDTLKACTWRMREQERRALLLGAAAQLTAAESQYTKAAELGTLHSLRNLEDRDKDSQLRDAFLHAYEDGLVASKAGRLLYDLLRAAAPDARCPLCGHGEVDTLDHHLPKSIYPLLAIVPLNLVPACSRCNHDKGSDKATSPFDQPLHPYFDDLGTDRWLHVTVYPATTTSRGTLKYALRSPATWDATLVARAELHFAAFRLAERYSVLAARATSGIRTMMCRLLAQAGPQAVRAHLVETADSYAQAGPNTWETALYYGLAESAWYTGGGMKEL